jgi:PKD repeat protein
MAEVPVTYTNAKVAMTKAGLPVSVGTNWLPVDQASWNTFVTQQTYAVQGYNAGPIQNLYKANYGFAYPTELPQTVTNLVAAENYTVTVGESTATGAAPLAETFTLTETNGSGESFLWNFGDGSPTVTTTVPTVTHTYTTAGTYTPSVISTVYGFKEPLTMGTPIVVT